LRVNKPHPPRLPIPNFFVKLNIFLYFTKRIELKKKKITECTVCRSKPETIIPRLYIATESKTDELIISFQLEIENEYQMRVQAEANLTNASENLELKNKDIAFYKRKAEDMQALNETLKTLIDDQYKK
jgi:outer membrane lipopolysaccharide assembly protein LptE/RlpB